MDFRLFVLGQFAKQCIVFVAHFARDDDLDFDMQVADMAVAGIRQAFASQSDDFAWLGSGRDLEAILALDQRDLHGGSQDGLAVRNGDAAEQVVAFTLKDRVIFDFHIDIQVAARSALQSDFAFATQAQLHAVVHAGGNLDRQLDGFIFAARAVTSVALVANHLALTTAGGAGGLNAKEALRLDDLSGTAAIVADFRSCAGFRT